jgi:ribonucleoside-diphosphate reductase alpha chain
MSQLNIDILSDVTVYTKYSKFIQELNRRETWKELVYRNRDMHCKKYPFLREAIVDVYEKFVLTKKVLPSMRSMQFSGKAIELNHARIYNCCYLPMDSYKAFREVIFLLLSGTGVGYSVQRHHVNKLPSIRKPTKRKRFIISDDIIGWACAVDALIKAYLNGAFLPEFDFSDIRKKGTLLKTSGGKAPGPEPLRQALLKIKEIFESKENGERLTTLEVHDINCHLADAVLSGGIRRAAMIALFSLDDELMLNCKGNIKVTVLEEEPIGPNTNTRRLLVETPDGKEHNIDVNGDYNFLKETGTLPWYKFEPQRGRANNSAVFVRHKGTKRDFDKFWRIVKSNNSGEPGIYFTNNSEWGTNPCAEISLRPFQFCNLTEINANTITNQEELEERAMAAAFIGTLQAGYTDFHYLRDEWKETTERDALLGIGVTGIAGVDYRSLDWGKAAVKATETNRELASKIGIKPAARLTTIKPSGTTSLVLGSSSGVHAWYSDYYIRRMQFNKQENIYQYLAKKLPQLVEDWEINPQDAFLMIPIKAPEGAATEDTETAMQFLARVSFFHENWIKAGHYKGDNTHNVSATVKVKEDEWDDVGKWMWDNRHNFNGLAVLPHDGSTYKQAPHEKISKEKFEELSQCLGEINLAEIKESNDETKRVEELACAGGLCERPF